MSLASLAAYSSSDEDEDTVSAMPSSSAPQHTAPKTDDDMITSQSVSSSADLIVDEDDLFAHSSAVTSSLPKADIENGERSSGNMFQADDVVDDVPLASSLPKPKPNKGERVQIILPSLSQFNDEEEPPVKKVKSIKGSGLFSILPPPRSGTMKMAGRPLVPLSVSRPAPTRSAKSVNAAPSASRPRAPAPAAESDDDDQDDLNAPGDFFSLSEDARVPPLSVSADEYLPVAGQTTSTVGQPQMALVNNDIAAPVVGPTLPMDTDVQCSYPSADNIADSTSLQEEAMHRLRGRRPDEAEMNIIDVNQDDILPDRQAWLTKHLTEEKATRRPHKPTNDPTTQQSRRKHQITYLAQQAKDREVDLKNEWSQNRASKQVYKSKYGF